MVVEGRRGKTARQGSDKEYSDQSITYFHRNHRLLTYTLPLSNLSAIISLHQMMEGARKYYEKTDFSIADYVPANERIRIRL